MRHESPQDHYERFRQFAREFSADEYEPTFKESVGAGRG
jgi:hypothetical protein